MRRYVYLLLILLSEITGNGQSIEPVLLDTNNEWSVDHRFVSFMSSQALTPEKAYEHIHQFGGDSLKSNNISFGRTEMYCWLYGRLKNNAHAKSIILVFERADVHRFECFRINGGGVDTLAITGDAFPFPHRPLVSNYFAIQLTLAPFEEANLLLLLDKRHQYLGGKLGLYTFDEFNRCQHNEFTLVLCFLSVLGFILLFNLFLYISLRDTIHLIFIAELICCALSVFTFLGYSYWYLWPDAVYRGSILMAIFPAFLVSTNLFLMRRLLGLNSKNSRFTRIVSYLAWTILVLSIGGIFTLLPTYPLSVTFFRIGNTVMELIQLLTIIVVLSVLAEQLTKGNRAAYFYALAMGLVVIGTVVSFMTRNNIWVINSALTSWLIPSYLFEQVTLSFGLTSRYNLLQHQNHAFQLLLIKSQQQVMAQTLQAQDSERERIAADLHDDLGGVIATINHQLTQSLKNESFVQLQQNVQQIQQIVAQAADKVRHIAHNLMPPDFERIGLVDSVLQLVSSLNDDRFRFLVFGKPRRLAPDVELNAYRIVTELIQNIQKHAQAQQVLIQLLFHETSLNLIIEDDGLGSRAQKNRKVRKGIGLKNISSRVNYLHGSWQTDATEQGTTTLIEIPYESNSGQHPDRRRPPVV